MKVHNILEELVANSVNEMFLQLKEMSTPWLTCDCEHCRLDVTSYVLNRLPPKYVVSGRGAIYNNSEDTTQLVADIESLVMEAIRVVNSVQRPYHNTSIASDSSYGSGPTFNFPTFFGTVYNGQSFEPLSNAKVTLKVNNEIATMIDYTWSNPCTTDARSKSTYTFLVKPVDAETENESKVFDFTINIEAEGFDNLAYSFSIPVISSAKPRLSLNSTYSLKIQDLFMFPKY